MSAETRMVPLADIKVPDWAPPCDPLIVEEYRLAFERVERDGGSVIDYVSLPALFADFCFVDDAQIKRIKKRCGELNGFPTFEPFKEGLSVFKRLVCAEGDYFRGPPPPRSEPSVKHVYFIRCTVTGAIKIGNSISPKGRVGELQPYSPTRLELLATIPGGGMKEEKRLHKHFAHCNLHGEWFSPSEELMSFIKEHGTPWDR